MQKKIILFELNEVPLKVIHFFMKARPGSALARIYPFSSQYETFTEDGGHLSPWVTWPTVHRGVTNHKHGISDFGQPLQEIDQQFPPVWKILTEKGVRTGVCGSLHSYVPGQTFQEYDFYIPDIFANEPTCWPRDLEGFQAFCLSMARESAKNVSDKVPRSQALGVLRDAHKIGLRFGTLANVAGQLLDERLKPWKVVRRRTYQSVLAFDVFLKQLQTKRPDFSTFFTNHVASAMHRYWQATFPEDYEKVTFDEEWLQTYHGEIIYAMQKADEMIGSLARFVEKNPDYSLVITSSMGQQAVNTGPVETLLHVTVPDPFMKALGFEKDAWDLRPAMFPQLNVRIYDPARRAEFEGAVKTVEINGVQIYYRPAADGFFSLDFGHENLRDFSVRILGREHVPADVGINNVEIQDKAGVTAYHIPQGSLLIYNQQSKPNKGVGQVSTSDICPAILQNYAVDPAGYMNRPSGLFA